MITINTMKENLHVYNSKFLILSHKIRHFRVLAECIFLYNRELWTTTKTINDNKEYFHRRQLRYALGVKSPRVITNQQLYDLTKCEPWSIVTTYTTLIETGNTCWFSWNTIECGQWALDISCTHPIARIGPTVTDHQHRYVVSVQLYRHYRA